MGHANGVEWQTGRDWHRHAVQQFVCASPDRWQWSKERGKYHPHPWEIAVQSQIRELKPRLAAGEKLVLGMDADRRVAAVSYFGYDNTGEQFFIWAIARSVDHAGRGLGAAALEWTMKALYATKAAEKKDCGVFARIDPRNEPSKRLFARFGFYKFGVDGDLEYWVHELQ